MSRAKTNEPLKAKKIKKSMQTLKGMRDIVPTEQKYWEFVRKAVKDFYLSYGFSRIDLPILEAKQLFLKGLGKNSPLLEDIYSFVDEDGNKIALRPEATISVARAFIEHGMINQSQPVKLFYEGPMFRRNSLSGLRYRQFHQYGFEVLGTVEPLLDAQVIFINYRILLSLGLSAVVNINSVGCTECQSLYQKALSSYYRTKRSELCEASRKVLNKDPLQVLSCTDSGCQKTAEDAPQFVDYLCDDCREHFMKVLDYLDEMNVPYLLKNSLIGEFPYYTRTVFEFAVEQPNSSEEESGGTLILGGGGRYDKLVSTLGGDDAPGCGVAMNIEKIINALKSFDVKIPQEQTFDVFVAQIGEEAKKKSMLLFESLRSSGFRVAENLIKAGLKAQLEMANRLKVKYALILGQKEIMDGTIMIRDMENGIQEIVDFRKVVQELKKRLEKQVIIINDKGNNIN